MTRLRLVTADPAPPVLCPFWPVHVYAEERVLFLARSMAAGIPLDAALHDFREAPPGAAAVLDAYA